nr:NAD(P)H-dependent oxidoreductase [Luteimonas sp. Y-2-2-4F]
MDIFVSPAKPLVVGIGGTPRAQSSTEHALRLALAACAERGAATIHLGSDLLVALPHYAPGGGGLSSAQLALVNAVRRADAVIIATPSYHGAPSGLVKNALDTLEELRADARPYLDGRAVGCIVTAYGPQSLGTVLAGLRSTVHALRGWPTPYAAAINTRETSLTAGSEDGEAAAALTLVAQQTVDFANAFRRQRQRQQLAECSGQVAVRSLGA